MMMSKPAPEKQAEEKPSTTKNKKPADAVADLERRLAELSSDIPAPAAAPAVVVPEQQAPPPAFPPPPAAVAAPAVTATTTAKSSNKNALLARIMAAQERAKQQQGGTGSTSPPKAAAAAAPPPDLLSMEQQSQPPPPPPPPAFEESLLPPAASVDAAPPAFDELTLPEPSAAAPPAPVIHHQFDPHAAAAAAPPSASAPAFEDLMMGTATPMQVLQPPETTNNSEQQQQEQEQFDEEALQAIFGSMEGLSEAEKVAMINEQKKIMQSIEASKQTAQVSAADAFEQRSFSAAVQSIGGSGTSSSGSGTSNMQIHGQERTVQAIADGTATTVQCPSCTKWMQVTNTAQLMFCPVCQTVSPVNNGSGSMLTQEQAQQMAADAKLAEQLQKEEYNQADAEQEQQQSRQQQQAAARKKASSSGSSSSWMEWLGFGTPAPAPTSAAATREPQSGEITFTPSNDSGNSETGGGVMPSGRVATQQPLFACVTDSISTAVQSMQALPEDAEGNVHGVDASSLLAVTQVGREQQQNNNDSNHGSDYYDRTTSN